MTKTEPAQPRHIDYMLLSDLRERRDPRNVKAHADGVIDASFERFGYVEPVQLDERTGRLVAGHGRVDRISALAGTITADNTVEPPEGVVVGPDGGWFLPVVRGWSSANDAEAEAYMITANRAGEVGGWTDELAASLEHLQADTGHLPPGFTADDLDDLLASLGAGQLPDQGTDAAHADDLSGRGDPATPRQQQGLHEVGLMFQDDHHAEYLALVGHLKRRWGAQLPLPMLVLRALRLAKDYDGTEAE